MCVDTHAVITFRLPGSERWNTRYLPHVCQDEIQDFAESKVKDLIKYGYEAKWSMVPCQQCHECRLQRSRMWANRCVLEMEDYPDLEDGTICNWFVTLTYDEDHVSELRSDLDHQTLTLHQKHAKAKDHLQMFLDALRVIYKREYNHEGIRFFACGEYGDKNLRPHYHVLLFNCPIPADQLEPLFQNKFGDQYYNSDVLTRAWAQKGFAVASSANWNNAAYTARYIMKKQTGENAEKVYNDLGISPPFVRMSRMPGIAGNAYKGFEQYAYIDPDGVLHRKDQVTFKNAPEKIDPSFRPPRYFDRLLEKENSDLLSFVKEDRQRAFKIAYETSKKMYPISDRELFENRIEAYNKRPIGAYRKFIELHDGT